MNWQKQQKRIAIRLILDGSGGIFGDDGNPQSQSLNISVYQSLDNPNSQTLWVFGDSSHTHYGSSIRSSGNSHWRDSWKIYNFLTSDNFYSANKPTNRLFSLSPLTSASNPKDLDAMKEWDSLDTRNEPDYAHEPTINIGGTSRPIGKIFMNDGTVDEMGIRVTPPNLVYSSNAVSRWFGAGILNKPIGDFYSSTQGDRYNAFRTWHLNSHLDPPLSRFYITGGGRSRGGGIYLSIHDRPAIPEPEEYALVFGLFALAFVIIRRRFQKI